MTLRLKINLIVGVLSLLFVAAVLALQFASMRDSVHEETVAANRVAAQLLQRAAGRSSPQGTAAMLEFLQGIGRVRSNDITLFDSEGRELYRSPPSPYKAGRDAPRWFEALIAPEPALMIVALPDGQMDLRANASRAALDAWDGFVGLVWAGVALLLAVNLLVFWLVGRTLRPFGQIVGALDELQAGRFDVALPPLAGAEAAAIGTAFNRMVGVLRANLDVERRAVQAEGELSDNRELTRWIERCIEQERKLIARELHDELGQSVTAMRSMALSIAQRTASDPQVEQAARLIADESSRLYDAMHGIIPRLAPLALDSLGLGEALTDLVQRTRRNHAGVEIALQIDLAGAAVSSDAALALYRVAQEGLTNALRHGRASRIALRVEGRDDEVTLTVTDNGEGLAANGSARTGHHGLRWMTERVEGLGGRLSIEPAEPQGAQLRVSLPLALAPETEASNG